MFLYFTEVNQFKNFIFTCFQVPKQKYHISTKTNKVYDLTERKVSFFIICI